MAEEMKTVEEPEKKEPTFWQACWTWLKRAGRWVLAPLPAILLVVGAIILVVVGVKNIQVGGLLNKLLGREKEGAKTVDVANSIPEDRVDAEGKIIPPGTPDSQGTTQAVVVPIKPPGLFDDPTKVEIVPPGEGKKPIVVTLPDGVKSKDVDKVVVVTPDVYAVTVKDSSGIPAKTVDDLLEKYGN
jgi:hypothetical protein